MSTGNRTIFRQHYTATALVCDCVEIRYCCHKIVRTILRQGSQYHIIIEMLMSCLPEIGSSCLMEWECSEPRQLEMSLWIMLIGKNVTSTSMSLVPVRAIKHATTCSHKCITESRLQVENCMTSSNHVLAITYLITLLGRVCKGAHGSHNLIR